MMNVQDMVQKTKELMAASSCSSDTKEACQRWLDAVGTEREKAETELYLKELEEAVVPIDGLIAFAGSEAGKKIFGEAKAGELEAHAKQIKAEGAQYCDCPACAKALEILGK